MLKQSNIQSVALLLLAGFSHFYSENCDKNSGQKNFRNLHFGLEKKYKFGVKEVWLLKRLVHQNERKYFYKHKKKRCLEGLQESSRPHSLQSPRCKSANISFEKVVCGPLLKKGCLGNWFPGIYFTMFADSDPLRLLLPWSKRVHTECKNAECKNCGFRETSHFSKEDLLV